jgi:hypothetical protein
MSTERRAGSTIWVQIATVVIVVMLLHVVRVIAGCNAVSSMRREGEGIGIHDCRSQGSLRHLIHYVYDLRRILLLDYSDWTRDASPNTPPQTEYGKWFASSSGCIKTFVWRKTLWEKYSHT